MVTVIPHVAQASARQARACVQTAVSAQARSEASEAGTDADSALGKIQTQRTDADALSEENAHDGPIVLLPQNPACGRTDETRCERMVGERGFEPPTPWSRTIEVEIPSASSGVA